MEVQSTSTPLDTEITVKTAKFGDTCQTTKTYDTDTVNQLYLTIDQLEARIRKLEDQILRLDSTNVLYAERFRRISAVTPTQITTVISSAKSEEEGVSAILNLFG